MVTRNAKTKATLVNTFEENNNFSTYNLLNTQLHARTIQILQQNKSWQHDGRKTENNHELARKRYDDALLSYAIEIKMMALGVVYKLEICGQSMLLGLNCNSKKRSY